MRALLDNVPDLIIDKDHMMVISPDEGALDRTTYFANVLGVNIGMFYKRRDYSVIVNGKNPIVAHEFLGDNIDGKDIVIVDDMISSGGSMLDTARQLKEMNARRVFICTTFGLFTDGMAAFDEAYEKGWFDKVITTNLTYQIPELLSRPYYIEADMSKFLASIIDFMNHDVSMSNVLTPTEKIRDNPGKIQQARILFVKVYKKRANHCKVQNGSLFFVHDNRMLAERAFYCLLSTTFQNQSEFTSSPSLHLQEAQTAVFRAFADTRTPQRYNHRISVLSSQGCPLSS